MNVIIEPESFAADSLRNALGGDTATVTGVSDLEQTLARTTVDTVIIGPGVDQVLALRQAELLRTSQPTLGVVLVRERVDAAVLTAALRAGVREVVSYRDLTGLLDSVERSSRLTTQLRNPGASIDPQVDATDRGQVIAVASPKGGSGKTTVATNLAAAWADRGHRVALVDLDVMFGDVAITLGIDPEHTITDATGISDHLDIAAVRRLMTHHSSGLNVLAAPTEPSSVELISSELVGRLLTLLVSDFDYVVLDTPPALDESILAILEQADRVVMITTLDVPAMKNVKVSLDTLRILDFPMDSISLVLNRADSKVGIDASQVSKTLNMPVVANLPSSRSVPTSTNRGVVLTLEDRNHAFTKALNHLADSLTMAGVETAASVPAPEPTVVKPTRRSMFRIRRTA